MDRLGDMYELYQTLPTYQYKNSILIVSASPKFLHLFHRGLKTFPSCNHYLFDTAKKEYYIHMSVKLAPKMSSSYNQVNSYDPDESDRVTNFPPSKGT